MTTHQKHFILRKAKIRAEMLGLPMLKRKWGNIDKEFISRVEISKHRIKQLKQLLLTGMQKKDIAKEFGVCCSAISNMIRRHIRRSCCGGDK